MITLDGNKVEVGKFPDGTILMKRDGSPLDFMRYGFFTPHSQIVWQFENNEEMIVLMYLVKHLNSCGIKDIMLIMPYIPNARQDRVKSEEDVFTLKYFAEFINSLGFSSVTVLDPHSYVSEALINNIRVQNPKYYINNTIDMINSIEPINSENRLMAFYPDEGAMKRYSGLLDMPYAFGIKMRDWATGQIKGLDVSGMTDIICDSNVLIIDDICSRGGTFYHSAKKLKELGAKNIYLYVSHCENTILQGDLLTSGLIERVFTTDSIFTKTHEKIEVMNYDAYKSYAFN